MCLSNIVYVLGIEVFLYVGTGIFVSTLLNGIYSVIPMLRIIKVRV